VALFALLPLLAGAQTETEPNDNTAQANTITLGTAMNGDIGPAPCSSGTSDDYFALNLAADGRIDITTNASNSGGGTSSIRIYVLNSSGGQIDYYDHATGANNSPMAVTSTKTCMSKGLYYFKVVTLNGGLCFTYGLTITETAPVYADDTEPNNDFTQALANPTLLPNTTTDGHVNFSYYGDNDDRYHIVTPGDGVLNVTISAEAATAGNTRVYIFDALGNQLTYFDKPIGTGGVAITSTQSFTCYGQGEYYFLVNSQGPCGVSYQLSYTVTPHIYANDAEPDNDFATALPMAHDTYVEGHMNFAYHGDNADYYAISSTPTDGSMVLTMIAENAGVNAGSIRTYIYDTLGNQLDYFDSSVGAGGDDDTTTATFHCYGEGAYYLYVTSVSGCGQSYKLKYTMENAAYGNDPEPNNTLGTAAAMSYDTFTDGHVAFNHYGDNADYFNVAQTPEDGMMELTMISERIPQQDGSIRVYVYDSGGNQLHYFDSPSGGNSDDDTTVVTYPCHAQGEYSFLVTSVNGCGLSYRLKYRILSPVYSNDTEPNNSTGDADLNAVLPAGTSLEGHVNFAYYGDNQDFYRIETPEDGTVNITITSEAASPGNVRIYLLNSSGSQLQYFDSPVGTGGTPASNTQSYTCVAQGTYYLWVQSQGPCGISYELGYTVTPPVYTVDTEPNNSFADADNNAVLPPDTSFEGHVNFNYYGDNADIYRIETSGDGTLNITIASEAASGGNVRVYVYNASGSQLLYFDTPVGTGGTPASHTQSYDCIAQGTYYLWVLSLAPCGISYQLGYTVTPPVYGNDPEPDGSLATAVTFNPDSSHADGHVNFAYYGETSDYYRMNLATAGDISFTLGSEAASGGNLRIYLLNSGGGQITYADFAVGAAHTPSSNTVNFTGLAAGTYYLDVVSVGPCGISYRFNCNDADGDGTCNYFDLCPGGPEPGTPCDDGSVCTTGDAIDMNCTCTGTAVPIDDGNPCTLDACDPIAGVTHTFLDADGDGTCDANDLCPGGPEPGTACDDGDPNTVGDAIDANCTCVGTASWDCPALQANIGDACDDASACTESDAVDANCVCTGTPVNIDDGDPCTLDACDPIAGVTHTFLDADNDGTCDANDLCPGGPEPGTACDDGDPNTVGDAIDANCVCVGTASWDCPALQANIGDACDDGDACTTGDVVDANCVCTGTFQDTDGDGTCDASDLCPGGPEPGTACDDGSACTTGDVIDANCVCAGTFQDADNDGTCDASDLCPGGPEPGTACDDGDPNTTGDAIDANCVCTGTPSGGPCTGDQVVVNITTDANPGDITWEVTNDGGTVIANGAPAAANTLVSETVCLNAAPTSACYGFRLMDGFGDGITNGGWELRTTDNKLILSDDFAGGSQSPSATPLSPGYGDAHSFCLPLGPSNIKTRCGIFNNVLTDKVFCNKVTGATQYQFEFSDPDAGRIRRIARSTNYVRFMDMVSSPLIPGVVYFARVRTNAEGPIADAHWGTGCEMALGQAETLTCSELIMAPHYGHSCNEDRTFNTNNSFIYAKPVVGGTEYQFHIYNTSEGYDQTFVRSTYILQLKWNNNVAPPLLNGSTYNVEINVKVSGMYTGFCPSSCTITIDNSGSNFGAGGLMDMHMDAASLWPNPVRDGQVNLSLTGLDDAQQQITVDIQDIYGKQVYAKDFANNGERFSTILQLPSTVASGVYLVNITVNGKRTVQRLSIIR
jgi:hypothetical protein